MQMNIKHYIMPLLALCNASFSFRKLFLGRDFRPPSRYPEQTSSARISSYQHSCSRYLNPVNLSYVDLEGRNIALVKGLCCSLISAGRRKPLMPTLLRSW